MVDIECRAAFLEPRDLAHYSRVCRRAFQIYEFMLDRFASVTNETISWRNGCQYTNYSWQSNALPNLSFNTTVKERPIGG